MENCFRFLINVDQCLNMSAFDIFFYKKESQHRFHSYNVQLFGDSYGSSLRRAVMDIRAYLDKYPYHVEDFQIVVAMRTDYQGKPAGWEQSLLCRLLQISAELQNAHIFINSRESGEKVLSMVMLYDADFSVDLPELDHYMSGERFREDCRLMLEQLGLQEQEGSRELVEAALATYEAKQEHDPQLSACMRRYMAFMDSYGVSLSDFVEEETVNTYFSGFSSFLREELANFQVHEANIDRNNRRQNMLALLRVVDFINMSLELPIQPDGNCSMIPLAHRCQANWQKVWADRELELRYAKMLRHYQRRLNQAALELERPKFQTAECREIPPRSDPSQEDIVCTNTMFTQMRCETKAGDLKGILDHFLAGRFRADSAVNRWEKTYNTLKNALNEMEYQLGTYAADLSRKYAAVLERRKADTLPWRTECYTANQDVEKDIHQLEHDRGNLFKELKSRHIEPGIRFQDQLNMENALEQANTSVRFYMRCISNINRGSFLALILACLLTVALHYTVLQPYVFQSTDTLLSYGLCLLCIFLCMLVCWGVPYSYFRRKTAQCIAGLKESMDKYIPQYFLKAENFKSYINLLNRLDYITRYHRLLSRGEKTSRRLSQGYLWHKIQVRKHLDKLQLFQGLIDTAPAEEESENTAPQFLPTVQGGTVMDVVDSPIYWPQGEYSL